MMKFFIKIILITSLFLYVSGDSNFIETDFNGVEEVKIDMIAEIILNNFKSNGWNNILLVGRLPDLLYHRLKNIPYTFAVTNIVEGDVQIENVVPYHSNIIVMSCNDIAEVENTLKKIVTLAYWDALANIILYYHMPYEKNILAKIFFYFWFYRAVNVIVVQYNNTAEEMYISHFSPYISENHKMDNLFGCWKVKKIGLPFYNFNKSFICEKECHNVSLYSKLRANFLGTCIGFNTKIIRFGRESVKNFNFFESKAKNLHGFTFLAYAIEVLPFFGIKEHKNGTFTFYRRDGMIWNTIAELFNFTIDLFPTGDKLKQKFDFEVNVMMVFSFTQRKADLLLFPLYQFDLIIAEVDYTVPFLDSGVCVLSQRADFKTIVFDEKLMQNICVIVEFSICFFCTWFVFFIFNTEQLGRLNVDQAGKDLVNTFRTVLSISLYNPPKRGSFRIFLIISIWSFFVINFSTQAAIISLFSVHKRGKEVDTFSDVVEKGYKIQGLATPDMILPDDNEIFRIIDSRTEVELDMFECVSQMSNDSRRFCLIDCAVGRYLVRNMLNEKGEQFLHIATNARIHSHYLNMILHKDSPLTENFNKYIMKFFEAGLIRKWMEYRYVDMKEEAPIKPLGIEELRGIFQLYGCLLAISSTIFLFELFLGFLFWSKRNCSKILKRLKIFQNNEINHS